MEISHWVLIIYLIQHCYPTKALLSWTNNTDGLKHMLLSYDKQNVFITDDFWLYRLNSTNLVRTSNVAELDGVPTVIFNINNHTTVCFNRTGICNIYNTGSVDLEKVNGNSMLAISSPYTSVLVTEDRVFIACPHKLSNDYTSAEVDVCKNPGISWKIYRNGQFEDKNSNSPTKFIKFKSKDKTPIKTQKYLASFSVGRYLLFFSKQQKGDQSATRVAHMCQSNFIEYTYVDMEISCGGWWDMADVTTFTVDDETHIVAVFNNQTQDKANVCVYTLPELQNRLIQNFNVCYQAQYHRFEEFDYIKRSERCQGRQINTAGGSFDYLCDGLSSYSSVVGIYSLDKEPILSLDGQINGLTVVKHGREVMAYFGTTNNGQIKKAVIVPSSDAREIPFNVSLGAGTSVQHDMYMDHSNTAVIAFTNKAVFKISVQQCDKMKGCNACLQSRDPSCGWCILDNRCSVSQDCTTEWIPAAPSNSLCPTIGWVTNPYLSVDQESLMVMKLSHLPDGVTYMCRFHEATTGFNVTVDAVLEEVVPQQLKVSSPDVRHLADQIRGSLVMQVSILTNVSTHPMAISHFVYYNCDTITSCSMCTQPNWKCRWCIYKERCESLKQTGSVCSDSLDVGDPSTAVAESCPNVTTVLLAAPQSEGTYFMSHDRTYNVQMVGRSFPQPHGDMDYTCKISPMENGTSTAVYRNNTHLDCFFNKTQYQLMEGQIKPTLSLYWGNHLVDGSELEVFLYRCEYLTRSCDKCKSFTFYQPHYLCHWCSNSCRDTNQQCQSVVCPPPNITQVSPMSAAVNSSVILTIKGFNLGANFTDIQGAVRVGELSCAAMNESYVPAESISCELDPSIRELQANITVSLPDRQAVKYRAQFHVRIPEIHTVFPTIGPQSGGTTISISGKHLNTGLNRVIYIENSICRDTQTDRGNLTCVTDKMADLPSKPLPIAVVFDNGTSIQGDNITFEYMTDPDITGISPRQSYQSGGRKLTVTGTNLHVIQKPAVFVTFPDGTRSKDFPCSAISNTEIKCPSPPALKKRRRRKRTVVFSSQHARLGFKMDGVSEVQNLPETLAGLEYFQDPIIPSLDAPVQYHDILVIKGERLAVAADQEDILVYIGDHPDRQKCNITSLRNDSIYCNPPKVMNSEDKLSKFTITIKIGYLTFIVGQLNYEVTVTPTKDDDMINIIVIVSVVSVVAILTIILLLVLFKLWKNKKRTREVKSALEFKLDKLEATFRTQCREEFAALQTAVSDLTSDLEGGNALFRDYSLYANKTLFASSMSKHTLMSTPPTLATSSQQALDNFKGLLRHTQFLLLFIRTMEKQESFSIHDRSNVATILMVINHDNLEFITDILKTLLNELVDKNIAAQTPKLMLRRSERVSEKLLTHWLSVCLYHFLKNETGSPLYFLYKAIKTQIDKGPVDYITGCGKYTLSEDKLFTAADTEMKNEAKTLKLQVQHFHYLDNEEKDISAAVLDCDTVTQAKSKMLEILYKNVPFSQRPPVHKTLLEIEDNGATRCINDEDASSIKEGLWKKINTLQHYGVEDGTKARLSHSNEVALGTCNNVDSTPDFFIVGSYRKSKPVVRTISGSNYWHLTKQNIGEDEVKISSDFFLPRLISTKGTLQTFIDDLFSAVLHVGEEPPIIIKYLYDFLDAAAARHGITDPEVLHTWKCNSVILRFWVNILKNPEFVFDIHKPQIVDSCLSVVAQTLMDSCSTADLRLGPFSPSNKLLFAKDIPRYKQMVKTYFEEIQSKPAISDQDLNSFLTESVSQKFLGDDFNINSAILEMYGYAKQYKTELMRELDNLEASSPGSYFPIISKLEGVLITMDSEPQQQQNK